MSALPDFLSAHNLSAPNFHAVSFAFQKLNHHLHSRLQNLHATDPAILPRVCLFPTGNFALGLPCHGVPNRIVAFGSISADIYRDLVWEAVQRAPEYRQLACGVLEVQKLPELRFLISFEGVEFELVYYREYLLFFILEDIELQVMFERQ